MDEETSAPVPVPVDVEGSVEPSTPTSAAEDTIAQLSFGGSGSSDKSTKIASGAQVAVSPSSTFSQDVAAPAADEIKSVPVQEDSLVIATEAEKAVSEPLATPTEETMNSGTAMEGRNSDDPSEFKDEEEGHGSSEKRGLLFVEDGIETKQVLTEDAYSLLYTADFFSVTTVYALVIILLQGGMLGLTFWDLIKPGGETNNGRNTIGIPPGATPQVMIAQLLGMILTVMVMAAEGDFVIGISQLIEGYDDKYKDKFPNATWTRWLVTAVLQTISGSFLLIDSFILAMQSSTVIDLSLNLTALYFIQEIDEGAFQLGLTGMIAGRIKTDCEKVQEWEHETTKEYRRQVLLLKRRLIFFMLVALLVPYFVLVGRQAGGVYVCDNLYVQFGDAFDPKWGHYSGRFKSQGNGLVGGDRQDSRNFYIDEATGQLQLAYCESEEAWTFSLVESGNSCEYIFKSADTDTFDIMEVADQDWFYNTGEVEGSEAEMGDVKVDWLAIICNDCNEDICNPEYGTCSDTTNKCECKEGRYGLNCEFNGTTCGGFSLNMRTASGLSSIPSASYFLERTEYVAISENITLYDRFIYAPRNPIVAYMRHGDDTAQISSFIVFTGRRFVLYGVPETSFEIGVRSNWTVGDFYAYFIEQDSNNRPFQMLKNLTASSPNYFPLLFSSPVNYGQDSYTFDPVGLTWVLATEEGVKNGVLSRSPDDDKSTGAQLLCSFCGDEINQCHNGASCVGNTCGCPDFFDGHRCERALNCIDMGGCYNNGTCNTLSGLCDECNEGTFGRLCQYGNNNTEHYFCYYKCVEGWPTYCYPFDQKVKCDCFDESLYGGEFCDVPATNGG
ncbi:expressed unknown protein [Seminavis robusta]|uniref:EGF-like domain-containing protein n=1 Tax=Seminavis robusta TaxID=568900 RepID=A0A9N8DK56_9STRA|nr:expressed unknown protein [Seminavis robusta]|eukprot:Sro202_g085510.1 n/a (839) ;mRNA; f:75278-78408